MRNLLRRVFDQFVSLAAVPRKPVRVAPHGVEGDAGQRNPALREPGFQGPALGLDRYMRDLGVEPDMGPAQLNDLGGPGAGVDHRQQDVAGLGVEAAQRARRQKPRLDPPP